MSRNLIVKLLHPKAKVPKRGTPGSVGYDLYSVESLKVQPGEMAIVPTGISLEIGEGCYGRIAPRSSVSHKKLYLNAGVVDPDYRGELKIIIQNFSNEEYKIEVGDRVAQLILEKVCTPEVSVVDEISESLRGNGGFGSTGK